MEKLLDWFRTVAEAGKGEGAAAEPSGGRTGLPWPEKGRVCWSPPGDWGHLKLKPRE